MGAWNDMENREGVFEECTLLISVSGMKGVTHIGDRAFYNTAIGATGLGDIVAPKVESIGTYAFYGTDYITSFTSENIKVIGPNAFEESGITTLNLEKEITINETNANKYIQDSEAVLSADITIATDAFKNAKVESVDLSFTANIQENAFLERRNIERVRTKGLTVKTGAF